MEHLKNLFERAGLSLELADRPIMGDENVFQLDIQRRGKNQEVFRVWPGASDNRAEVTNIDRKTGQVVLMVHEPRRVFWMDAPNASQYKYRHKENWKAMFLKDHELRDNEIREVGTKVQIRQVTPSAKRHYLMGLDERQLFIAQLPQPVSTVRDAHNVLKSTKLVTAEGEQRGRTIRQGEWFFLNITKEEEDLIRQKMKQNLVMRDVGIDSAVGGASGTPHVAQELVIVPELNKVRDREVFVRGTVKHPDHKTLKLKLWRKVIKNAEIQDSTGRAFGVNWID